MPNSVVVIKEELSLPSPVVDRHFTKEFVFAADTPGAPRLPEIVPAGNHSAYIYSNIVTHILKEIRTTFDKGGVVGITSLALSHPLILEALMQGSTMALIQKIGPGKGTGLVDAYTRLHCAFRRDAFPGNIIPHLVRKDGQEDYGLIDSVRFAGNQSQTSRMAYNEIRPMFHPKTMLHFVPNKAGKLELSCVFMGSMNFSRNAEGSWEVVERITEPARMTALYSGFEHWWSHSEGLFHFNQGMRGDYTYVKKAVKHPLPTPCVECGSQKYVTIWARSLNNPEEVVLRLRCLDCGQRYPFLENNKPRVR